MNGKFFLFEFPSKEEAESIFTKEKVGFSTDNLYFWIGGIRWPAAIGKVVNPKLQGLGLWVYHYIFGAGRSFRKLEMCAGDSLASMK